MTWYWAWCHGVRRPRGSDATLSAVALMLRNSESLVIVPGWHWLSSSPRLQRRCLIRGGHYPSPGFARLQQRDPLKQTSDFFIFGNRAEKATGSSLSSRAGEPFFIVSASPDLKPDEKVAGSACIIRRVRNLDELLNLSLNVSIPSPTHWQTWMWVWSCGRPGPGTGDHPYLLG